MNRPQASRRPWVRIIYVLTTALAVVTLLGIATYTLYLPNSQLCVNAQIRLDDWRATKKKYADRGIIIDPAGPITSEEEQKLCNLPAF